MSAVRSYMSAHVHTIGAEQPVSIAADVMRKHKIRHLPVLHGGQLVGVISERDVALAEKLAPDGKAVTVQDIMSGEPYTVSPDAPIAEVARHMGEQRYGAALVVDKHDKLMGVFTTVDVCRALAEVLGARK